VHCSDRRGVKRSKEEPRRQEVTLVRGTVVRISSDRVDGLSGVRAMVLAASGLTKRGKVLRKDAAP